MTKKPICPHCNEMIQLVINGAAVDFYCRKCDKFLMLYEMEEA